MKIAFVMLNVLSTERMSVMLLSALAKQHLPDVEVELFVYSDGMLKSQIRRFEPDVVAYSAMTGEHIQYLKIARQIKNMERQIGKKIFQIMGGPHCTFAPEILKGSVLDAIGVGECDEAWQALLWGLGVG
ncbi:MAG: cobalamin-dependent protein, partial [bacterium]|nr:cobalamin-dependent protein [bacterium]